MFIELTMHTGAGPELVQVRAEDIVLLRGNPIPEKPEVRGAVYLRSGQALNTYEGPREIAGRCEEH